MSGGCRPTPPTSPIGSPEHVVLTLWTADAELAAEADAAGVDRIGVDLEWRGKAERQKGRGTWLSEHKEADLAAVVRALRRAKTFARVNPLNPDTEREVDTVIRGGAGVVMLPMVATPAEAEHFAHCVAGRAEAVLLVERHEALDALADLVAVDGIDEVHIGLNDMALSLGLPSRWMVLAGDMMLKAGAVVRGAGKRFSLGGIGRALDENLPLPADLVYAEYPRTGATGALLARSFRTADTTLEFEVGRARDRLAYWQTRTADELEAAHAQLERRVAGLTEW